MSYLSLFFAALLVCCLAFMGFKGYFSQTKSLVSPQATRAAEEQKINTTSYRSTVQDIHSQLKEASQKELDRVRDMEELR